MWKLTCNLQLVENDLLPQYPSLPQAAAPNYFTLKNLEGPAL